MTEAATIIVTAGAEPDARELRLHDSLGVPIHNDPQDSPSGLYLRYTERGLTLLSLDYPKSSGVWVDFTAIELQRRARQGLRRQGLGRAVGLKSGIRPHVLDATAGLGRDAFLLAYAGCRVTLCERSPLVFALLQDGLQRGRAAADDNDESRAADTDEALGRLTLRAGDFREQTGGEERFDVVYLDPMFPDLRRTAQAKKSMALLQSLLGGASDEDDLLGPARGLAERRVVVKRARLSPHLGGEKPEVSFVGSANRYDVYLTPNKA